MLELLNDHFSEILIGFFTLFGAFIGVLIPTIYNYYNDKKERHDKYFFAMINKRFEVYSNASFLCDQLKHLIHKPDEDKEKIEKTSEARKWFSKNSLYLEPEIRQSFFNFIHEVEIYHISLEDWRITGQEEGWNTEQTAKKKEELNAAFHEIMVGLQNKIQGTIDTYYEITHKKTI